MAQSPQAVTKDSAREEVLLFIGDSITEGYGVKKEEAYPEVIGRVLNAHGHKVKIVNGGISGSVTADADRRVKWFLKTKPDIVVIALGGNDALKGTPPAVIGKNLGAAIDLALANHLRVLLIGMRIFTNFGVEYSQALEQTYRSLAKEKKVAFMPFLLEGVALDRGLNQADGKHPNAKGHEIVATHVRKELERLL